MNSKTKELEQLQKEYVSRVEILATLIDDEIHHCDSKRVQELKELFNKEIDQEIEDLKTNIEYAKKSINDIINMIEGTKA